MGGLSVLSADGHDASRLETIDAPIPQVFGLLDDGEGLLVAGTDGVHRMVPDLVNLTLIEHERLLFDTHAYRLGALAPARCRVCRTRQWTRRAVENREDSWRSLGKIEGGESARRPLFPERPPPPGPGGGLAGRYNFRRPQAEALGL